MTELEKIEYAKSFIDKLANGINPLDDSPIPDNDIANNVRLSRCFFYVSDILRQVIDNGGTQISRTVKQRKKDFSLAEEDRERLQVSENPLSVSEISAYLNSLIDVETTKKISAQTINNWLLSIQMLELSEQPDGSKRKLPTGQGIELGIIAEERNGQSGSYVAILFSASAQQFIYDNLDAIIDVKHENNSDTSEMYGSSWTKEQEELLIDLFKKEVSIAEIATKLKRSQGGIRARLKRLGIIKYFS